MHVTNMLQRRPRPAIPCATQAAHRHRTDQLIQDRSVDTRQIGSKGRTCRGPGSWEGHQQTWAVLPLPSARPAMQQPLLPVACCQQCLRRQLLPSVTCAVGMLHRAHLQEAHYPRSAPPWSTPSAAWRAAVRGRASAVMQAVALCDKPEPCAGACAVCIAELPGAFARCDSVADTRDCGDQILWAAGPEGPRVPCLVPPHCRVWCPASTAGYRTLSCSRHRGWHR